MTGTLDSFSGAPDGRWCPICHRKVDAHQDYEIVPVCPVVYPEVRGLYVHETCIETERARDTYVVSDRPRNLFIRAGEVLHDPGS